MFTKKQIVHFAVLFLPVLIVGILIDVAYNLQVREHIEIDWLVVIPLAIVIDAFITWRQIRSEKDSTIK